MNDRIAPPAMLLVACGGGSTPGHDSGPVTHTDGGGSVVPPTGGFPASSTFYQDISGVPVDAESTTIMQALAASGWGSGLGIDVSLTIHSADANVARRPFENSGDDPDCDTAPVPLVPGGNTEGNDDYHCADGGNVFITATLDVDQVVETSSLRDIPPTDFEMVEGGERINWHDYECMRTVITD